MTRSTPADPIVGGNAGPVLRPDGKAIAVWNIEPDRLAEAACRLAGRNLTRSEWEAYLGDLGPHRATCPDVP